MILAEDLRKAVLQAAIQGKLVEHRPEEGTASELLADLKISDNIKGQRVKEKNITDFSVDDASFDIPETWEWVKLGTVCTIARGGSPRPIKEYITSADDGVNWIKIGDTEKNGKYIYSTAEKIKPSGVSKSRMVHSGDFLLTNSMSFGRPYILKTDGCIHDGWLVISQNQEVFDQDYLYWMLSSSYAYAQFCGQVSGAVVKNLNSDKVANSVFPLPPLAEQKRIVEKLERILLELNEYATAEQEFVSLQSVFPDDMRKSILWYAMQGKLVEQRPEEGTGEELYQKIQAEKAELIKEGKIKKEKPLPEITVEDTPFDIPESWKWCRLDDLAIKTIKRGKSPTYTTKSDKILVFAQKCNVKNGGIDLSLSQFLDEAVLDKYPDEEFMADKDIVINSTGTGTLGRVGIYSLADNKDGKLIVPDSHVTVVRLTDRVFSPYIYCIVCNYQKFLESKGTGSTKQKELKPDVIKALLIPLPPFEEQCRIAEKLDRLLPEIDGIKEAI